MFFFPGISQQHILIRHGNSDKCFISLYGLNCNMTLKKYLEIISSNTLYLFLLNLPGFLHNKSFKEPMENAFGSF